MTPEQATASARKATKATTVASASSGSSATRSVPLAAATRQAQTRTTAIVKDVVSVTMVDSAPVR